MRADDIGLLRQFSALHSGGIKAGDTLLKSAMEHALADRSINILNVLRSFYILALTHTSNDISQNEKFTGATLAAVRRLQMMSVPSRTSFLLATILQFSTEEISSVLNISMENAYRAIIRADHELLSSTRRRVLIIEDEPVIAMDISNIVGDIGSHVIGIAATKDEALAHLGKNGFDLVLADIQLADNSSGIDAVMRIMREKRVPTIFITAYPERLLTGERPEPTFLITKPFQVGTVQAAICQASFFSDDNLEYLEQNVGVHTLDLEDVPEAHSLVEPANSPVHVSVVAGQLQLVSSALNSGTPKGQLDAVRQEVLSDVNRLVRDLEGHNAGRRFALRLDRVEKQLSKPMDESSSLVLAVQVAGLRSVLDGLEETVGSDIYADANATVETLELLVLQFREWRDFLAEAEHSLIPLEVVSTSMELADTVLMQGDVTVHPELKSALGDIKLSAETGNRTASLALVRAISNVGRAISRVLWDILKGAAKELQTKATQGLANLTLSALLGIITATLAPYVSLSAELGWVVAAGYLLKKTLK